MHTSFFVLFGLACSAFAYPVSRDDTSGAIIRRGCGQSKMACSLPPPNKIKLPPIPEHLKPGHAYGGSVVHLPSPSKRRDDKPVGLHGSMPNHGDRASKIGKPVQPGHSYGPSVGLHGDLASKQRADFKIPDDYAIPHIKVEPFKNHAAAKAKPAAPRPAPPRAPIRRKTF